LETKTTVKTEHATTEHASKVEDRIVIWFVELMMLQLNVECDKDLGLTKIVVLGMVKRMRQEKQYMKDKKAKEQ